MNEEEKEYKENCFGIIKCLHLDPHTPGILSKLARWRIFIKLALVKIKDFM